MSLYSDTVKSYGAIAQYRLGETSGTTAVDSIGGNNGTISGGVTLNQDGAISDGNRAMLFNGTTGQIVAGSGSLSASFTIESWIRTSTVIAQMPVLSLADASAYYGLKGGQAFFYQSVAPNFAQGGPILTDGKWYHLVTTNNAVTTRHYVNGVEVYSIAQAHVTQTAGINISLFGSERWNGSIDEVAIYPTVLTPAQIANLFQIGRTAEPIIVKQIGIGVRELLVANRVYVIPVKTKLLNWQSPTGSTLLGSMDGVSFAPIGTSSANEIKQASSLGPFIQTSSSDTTVIAK